MTTMVTEDTVMQWLNDEVERYAHDADNDHQPPKLLMSPAQWVLPKLLRIVYQNADQPVEALAPLIRTMLKEQFFVTTGGDPCGCEHIETSINESVSMLVSVLRRVRKHCDKQKINR